MAACIVGKGADATNINPHAYSVADGGKRGADAAQMPAEGPAANLVGGLPVKAPMRRWNGDPVADYETVKFPFVAKSPAQGKGVAAGRNASISLKSLMRVETPASTESLKDFGG